jgi:hypothetical protein
MYLLCFCILHNNEEVDLAVRVMLQMEYISKLPNTVHSRSRHGVVAAKLTTEHTGSVVLISKANNML